MVVFLGSCHIKSHALSGGGLKLGGGDGRKEGSKVSKEEREATGSPAIMF